jgi:hypothetical protein
MSHVNRPLVPGWKAILSLAVLSSMAGHWPATVSGADLKAELRTSTWRSHYTTDSGPVRADVIFKGKKGVYVARGPGGDKLFVGTLTNVKYDKEDDAYSITGKWRAQGQSGTFEFDINEDEPGRFTGKWDAANGSDGEWKGHRDPGIPLDPEAAQILAGDDDTDDDDGH